MCKRLGPYVYREASHSLMEPRITHYLPGRGLPTSYRVRAEPSARDGKKPPKCNKKTI